MESCAEEWLDPGFSLAEGSISDIPKKPHANPFKFICTPIEKYFQSREPI